MQFMDSCDVHTRTKPQNSEELSGHRGGSAGDLSPACRAGLPARMRRPADCGGYPVVVEVGYASKNIVSARQSPLLPIRVLVMGKSLFLISNLSPPPLQSPSNVTSSTSSSNRGSEFIELLPFVFGNANASTEVIAVQEGGHTRILCSWVGAEKCEG